MTQPMASESTILAASQGGDQRAFAKLVEHYKGLVCAVTYGTTGDLASSEDLAQEAFVTAWVNIRRLRDPRVFRAWLCGIARNIGLRWLRKRQQDVLARTAPLDQQGQAHVAEDTPRDVAVRREEAAVVERALCDMPDGYRIPLILYYREGKSVEAVALALGMTEVAARQRLHRGRELLRDQVAALVESSLTKTRPGTKFTAGVAVAVSALPLAPAAKTAAAVAGSAATKGLIPALGARLAATAGLRTFLAAGIAAVMVGTAGLFLLASPNEPQQGLALAAAADQKADEPGEKPGADAAQVVSAQSDTTSDRKEAAPASPRNAATTEPAQEAIAVHPPDESIRIWEDTLPPHGPRGTLAGEVLMLDNEPAANVDVEAYANRGPARVAIAGTARTDRNGCFQMALPPDAYHLVARGKGLAAVNNLCMAPCIVRPRQTFRTQLRLEPALSLQGTVVDAESGRPLAGVAVVTWGGCRARTDACGAFALDTVHREDNEIRVVDEEWVSPSVVYAPGAGPCQVELRAQRAGVIRGHVYSPGGAPMEGVPVHLALSGSLWHFPFFTTFTDATGAYQIKGAYTTHDGLPMRAMLDGYRQANGVAHVAFDPGALSLDLDMRLIPDGSARYDEEIGLMSAGGPAEATAEAPSEAEESTSDSEAAPLESVSDAWVAGRVTDPEGWPQPAVFVISGEHHATTDRDGRFRMSGLTERFVDVMVITYGDMRPGATVARLEAYREDHELVVKDPECQVKGQVKDKATGQPVTRFYVGVGRVKDAKPVLGQDFPDFIMYEGERLVTSADGTFTLAHLRSGYGGRARLTVRAPGYTTETVPEVWLRSIGNEDEPITQVALAPRPADDTGFHGVIVAKGTDMPISDALVSINEMDGGAYSMPFGGFRQTVMRWPGSQLVRSDSSGAFAFPDWSDTKGWIAVTRPGFGRKWFRETEFRSPFRVELEPEATVNASIMNAWGRPVIDALITIYYYEGDQAVWNDSFETDENGHAFWRELSPGRYQVITNGLPVDSEAWFDLAAGQNHQLLCRLP